MHVTIRKHIFAETSAQTKSSYVHLLIQYSKVHFLGWVRSQMQRFRIGDVDVYAIVRLDRVYFNHLCLNSVMTHVRYLKARSLRSVRHNVTGAIGGHINRDVSDFAYTRHVFMRNGAPVQCSTVHTVFTVRLHRSRLNMRSNSPVVDGAVVITLFEKSRCVEVACFCCRSKRSKLR